MAVREWLRKRSPAPPSKVELEQIGAELARLAESDREVALSLGKATLDRLGEINGEDTMDCAALAGLLGGLCYATNRMDEAEKFMRRAAEGKAALLGRKHPSVAKQLFHLGKILYDSGRMVEAEAPLKEAVSTMRDLRGTQDRQVREMALILCVVYTALGRDDERRVLESWAKLESETSYFTVSSESIVRVDKSELPPDVDLD